MGVYISVVSHGHSKLINELQSIPNLVPKCKVVIKSNLANDNFGDWINSEDIYWIDDHYHSGFGRNNNINFNFCRSELGMNEDDYFIVLNPDVVVDVEEVIRLILSMEANDVKLATINLFKDRDFQTFDNSVRKFPSLYNFSKSFLGFKNSSIIDKSLINESYEADWAAGSFLAFRAEHYAKLKGFDENYFMYCEDIDICHRSYLLGEKVTYFPELKALHLAKHENRKILSTHFYWHVSSVCRFLLTRSDLRLTTVKSSILEY